jgi:hypothetical protein
MTTPFPSAPSSGRAQPLGPSPVAVAVADAAKAGVRAYGVATGRWRPAPELLIVGSKRGGTTSLWRYLAEHPGVLPTFPRAEHVKGVYFFDEHFGRGEQWYRSHFPTRARRVVVERRLGYAPIALDASPYYLFHPLAPARAREVVPGAQVVALLRDPVERAYSHWKERRNHSESLPFEAALAAEPVRTAGEEARLVSDPAYLSFAHRHQSYVAQGCYAPMLERWFRHFPADQITVLAAEDFYAAPQRLVDELCDRLGLPRRLLEQVEPFNAERSGDMDPQVRAELSVRLGPEIEKVEQLLGREMPWH